MMWKEWKHVLKMGLLGKDEVDYVHWQEIVVYKVLLKYRVLFRRGRGFRINSTKNKNQN